jgi:protein-L-isoaspartate(D-aspartate) O-methyltransferase
MQRPIAITLACFAAVPAVLMAQYSFAAENGSSYQAARMAMVREIREGVWETEHWIGKTQLQSDVMAAIASVPRHEFVPPHLRSEAYENRPLPIGYGQTISQPYIVALMTDLLQVDGAATVLEVGTGSGYQAAVLAEIVAQVYTIEIIPELADLARERLDRLGYDNVTVRTGDGYYGWTEHAPFDGIVVTAAASQIPPPLIRQLKRGARMIIPVGSPFLTQHLMLVQKQEDGTVQSRQILPVRFVPLTGEH